MTGGTFQPSSLPRNRPTHAIVAKEMSTILLCDTAGAMSPRRVRRKSRTTSMATTRIHGATLRSRTLHRRTAWVQGLDLPKAHCSHLMSRSNRNRNHHLHLVQVCRLRKIRGVRSQGNRPPCAARKTAHTAAVPILLNASVIVTTGIAGATARTIGKEGNASSRRDRCTMA